MMINLECYDMPNEIMVNNKGRITFYPVKRPYEHIMIDEKLEVVTLCNGLMYQIVRDILGNKWAVFIGQKGEEK